MFIMRLPSMFFMLALILYYVPKVCKFYGPFFRKAHIICGALSAITMFMAMFMQIGTPKLLQYICLSLVLALIVITGYLIPRQGRQMRYLHIVATFSFFAVLFGSIYLTKLIA